MFDRRDDPDHLLDSLETFVRGWHGGARAWYGIDPAKLAAAPLPDPLRRVYAFAGHWPGGNDWAAAFAHQDTLAPFELLARDGDRLVFAWENQGVWQCATSPEGRDPPVWVRWDAADPWTPLCDSLAQFLVTLCLQETVFGSRHLGHGEGSCARFRAAGRHVAPLWLDGPFPGVWAAEPISQRSFHLADAQILIMGDRWCGTRSDETARTYPDLFTPLPASHAWDPEAIARNLAIPAAIRRRALEGAAHDHEAQAEFHARRAAAYRQLGRALAD